MESSSSSKLCSKKQSKQSLQHRPESLDHIRSDMQGLRQTSHKKIATNRLIDLEVSISFLVKDDGVFDVLYLTLTFSTSGSVMIMGHHGSLQ